MSDATRRDILLRACYDLLKQAHVSYNFINVMVTTVQYDGTDCDGHCLMEDIAHELGIER